MRRRTPWIAPALAGFAAVLLVAVAARALPWSPARNRAVVMALARSAPVIATGPPLSARAAPTQSHGVAAQRTVAGAGQVAGTASRRTVASSRVLRVNIPGPGAGISTLGGYVYLPAGYDDPVNAAARYPVLYLLHGTPGWPSDWFQPAHAAAWMDQLVASGAIRPMILVAPTANRQHLDDSECLNAVRGPQMETYLTSDVVAYADANYRTLPDRGHRAIGGISSGGFCALNLGLRHQDEFSVVLGLMPYGDPGSPADVTHRLLGDRPVLYQQNTPSRYLPQFTFNYPMAFFLDAGSRDSVVLSGAERLKMLIASHRQTVTLRIVLHQSHSWRMARREVPYALSFAARELASP